MIERFNESKPFDIIRAEDFGNKLYEFYEPFGEYLRNVSKIDITASRPVFVIGGRGTGKTMLLKFLQFNMQLQFYQANKNCELNKDTIIDFFNEKKFIGLYLRFKSTEFDAMTDELADLFPQYFSLKIINELLSSLIVLKEHNIISELQEESIISFFNTCVVSKEVNTEVNDISQLKQIIENKLFPVYSGIINANAFYDLEEIKKLFEIPVINSKRLFIDFLTFIQRNILGDYVDNIIILLDELEYINSDHKKYIYQLIKNTDEFPISIKVGSRYLEDYMQVGNSNEILEENHDYRLIKIDEIIQNNSGGYLSVVKKILTKRLEKSKYFERFKTLNSLFQSNNLELEAKNIVLNKKKHWSSFKKFLKNQKVSEENINEIIKQIAYPKNPIIEKLNMLLIRKGKSTEYIHNEFNKFIRGNQTPYSVLYSKYKKNLVFQICNNYRVDKDYSGIDSIIQLSSGTVRHAIEICNQAMNNALFANSEEYILDKGIESIYQNYAIRQYSTLQYNNIAGIPDHIGIEIQDLVNTIGNIFRKLHLIEDLVEPEPTHFEIDLSSLKSEHVNKIIKVALNYSILQKKKPMVSKDAKIVNIADIYLNKIFAPYFKISSNLRGRSKLEVHQLVKLMTIKKKNQIINEVIVANSKKKSLTSQEIMDLNNSKENYQEEVHLFNYQVQK